MQLSLSTWPEVEEYLKHSNGILVPVGSTEQHGPLGLLGTDTICAEVLARSVGDVTRALVAPTIPVGMAHHHLTFPGSIALRPSTLMAIVRDYLLSLADHGFRRFLFLNGHGGNTASLQAALYETYSELRWTRGEAAPELRVKLTNWWDLPPIKPLLDSLFGDREGAHASPGEVSLTAYAYPGMVHPRPLVPETAPGGDFHDARDFRRRFPDGRIGSATGLASESAGKQIHDAAVPALVQMYKELMEEP